ncbi:hypothetical protein AB0M54_05525 [Actinoplanes sp. NPDC051470]|uniref:hypothetical protein n=1 Tax=unclassified Actinoplanes TaxID=2626549 RepID=UPI0034268025
MQTGVRQLGFELRTGRVEHPEPGSGFPGAIATIGAFVQGLRITSEVSDERLLTEAWRTLAITVFAVLVIGKPDAMRHVIADGPLVLATGIAYLLCRGWLAWKPSARGELVDLTA